MFKDFYLLSGLLVLMSAIMALHYLVSEKESTGRQLEAIVALSHISSPSLSVAYYEPRLRRMEKAANCAYPEMPALDRMDFVYAK